MDNTARVITQIPATINIYSSQSIAKPKRRRVAAYARVSTDSEEQLTSYEAQVDYYTRYINGKSEWEFAGMYTDEGISATNTKHREGFNSMISDALSGKIDLIITKSVSRFARNTVDSLSTVRLLKEKGVEVYFEKENIYTLDSKGELLITIMSSLAQEESRSISENVTWGQRKRFADGKVSMPYRRFLGYRKGPDGQPEIDEAEAKIVRKIYTLYLEGKTPNGIAMLLTQQGIPTPAKNQVWNVSTVRSILTNEKYKGDALLQKSFTFDFLTKEKRRNNGEVPQYYVENSHPAIISPEVFERVQNEKKRRSESGKTFTGNSCFSSKIICGECGSFYGSKVWHSNDKYRRVIWQCRHKYTRGSKVHEPNCTTPHLTNDEISAAFVVVMNRVISNKDDVISELRNISAGINDAGTLDAKTEALSAEMQVISEKLRQLVSDQSKTVTDIDEYKQSRSSLINIYEALSCKLSDVAAQKEANLVQQRQIQAFIDTIKKQKKILTEFDEDLWNAVIESVTVNADGGLSFRFKGGREENYCIK